MQRFTPFLRLAALLGLLLALMGAVAWPSARAQDSTTAQESPTTGDPAESPTARPEGTLWIYVATCTVTEEPASPVAILTDAEFQEQADCAEGTSATVTLDDGEAFDAPTGTQYALPVGEHTLQEVTTGASRDFTVEESVETVLFITTFEFVPPTEAPTEVPTEAPTETPIPDGAATEAPPVVEDPTKEQSNASAPEAVASDSIRVVVHLCRQGIGDQGALDALDSWGQKLKACPTLVLPKHADQITANAVTANNSNRPLEYGLLAKGNGDVSVALDTAGFFRAKVCEEALEEELNGARNGCYDQSGYKFGGFRAGSVTVSVESAPEGYTLIAGKRDDGRATKNGVASDAITFSGDERGDGPVHLFFAPTDVRNQVTIAVHLCPESVSSRGAFDRGRTLGDKLALCPSITREDDKVADKETTAGQRDVRLSIRGASGDTQKLHEARFEPFIICERDLDEAIKGDTTADLCVDASRYVFSDVEQGSVTVAVDRAPSNTRFLDAELHVGDDLTTLKAREAGVTELTTTDNGDVFVHVFFVRKPKPTPIPTEEPTKAPTQVPTQPSTTPVTRTPTSAQTGTVVVTKYVCEGEEQPRVTALPPNQQPGEAPYGCLEEAGSARLYLAGGSWLDASTAADGKRTIPRVPVTGGGTAHTFVDGSSGGRTDDVRVEAGKTTYIVSQRYYLSPEDDYVDDGGIDDGGLGEAPTLPPMPNLAEGDIFDENGDGVSEPVENVDANPFDNIDDMTGSGDQTGDPASDPASDPFGEPVDPEDEAAREQVALVDEPSELPTVGTRRAHSSLPEAIAMLLGAAALAAGAMWSYRRRTPTGS
jgi:hypothetical protein